MNKKPLISILIPTKNRNKAITATLESLARQTYKKFELIVVDGGSTDNTLDIVQSFQKKYPVKTYRTLGGLAKQMNTAWRKSSGEYVVRTDDDAVFDKDWLKSIVETYSISDQIGGVTGPSLIPKSRLGARDLFFYQSKFENGNLLWKTIGKFYYDYLLEGEPFRVSHWFKSGAFAIGSNYENCLSYSQAFEVDDLQACNWSVKRKLLKKIAGFDPIFSGIGEYHEPDAAQKIMKTGHKLFFNPKAIVYHQPSTEGFFKERPNAYSRALNFVNFYFRHIKPNSFDKVVRFTAYLIFINAFWIYKGVTLKQLNQFGSVIGTLVGLVKNGLHLTSHDS